jgi:hypothetical protein
LIEALRKLGSSTIGPRGWGVLLPERHKKLEKRNQNRSRYLYFELALPRCKIGHRVIDD